MAWLLIPAAAAGAATVSGTVKTQLVGQEAKVQAGVTVTVIDRTSGEGVASTATDSSGAYSVAAPSGTFDLRFDPPAESSAKSTTVKAVDLSKDQVVNVVLVPGEAVTFKGSVRTAAGEPVPGLRLYFDGKGSEVAGETNSEGDFSVVLSPGTYKFVIEYLGAAKPGIPAGFWEWDLEPLALEENRSAELVLPKTAQLTLHVAGSEGEPISAAETEVGPLRSQAELGGLGSGGFYGEEFSAKTDAEGNIHTTVFKGWAGKGTVRPPQSSGYGNTPFEIPAVEGNTTLEVKAQPAVTFKGSVRTAAGAPVAGLRLYFDSQSPEVAGETDAEGDFSVLLAPGTYKTVVEYLGAAKAGIPAGYWDLTFPALKIEADRSAELVLPETAQLTLHVAGSEGEPISAAETEVGPLRSQREFAGLGSGALYQDPFTRKTDAEGNIQTTVFQGWSGKGIVRPAQSSGYGYTPFEIAPVEDDTTLVLHLGAVEEPEKDVEAPRIDELKIEPDVVNPAASAQTVTLYAHIGDDLSGFQGGGIIFRSPSGKRQVSGNEFKRVAGDAKNGSYEVQVTFPQFSENGTWQIAAIDLTDVAGNEGSLEAKQIEELGLSHEVFVQSGEGGEDFEAPRVEGLSIEPPEINTAVAPRTATVIAHIIDNFTGFKSGSVTFTSPSGEQQITASEFKPLNGDAKNGSYEIPVTFEKGSEAGSWFITAIHVSDAAGNERVLGVEEMEERGLSRRVIVSGEKEPEDTEPPRLQNLAIEPASIDTSTTKQPAFITATVSDNLSGFKEGAVAFISPSKEQIVEGGEFELLGSEAEGTYRVVATFPQGSEPGDWEIAKVRLRDRAGNEVSIPGAAVEEAGLPHTVNVQAVQQVNLTSSLNPTVYGQKATFTAQVVAKGGPAPLGTVAFIDGTATLGVANLNSKGIATFSTTQLGAGEHSIAAAYSGDANHPAGKSAPVRQVVNRASTAVTLTSSLNPAPFDATGTLKASVFAVAPGAGTPAGTVTFREGETVLEVVQLSGHNASIPLKSLPVGAHEITAAYSGDPNDEMSESEAFTQTIVKADTETILTSTLNPASFGSSGTLKATIKAVAPGGGVPTGTVTFREGESVLAIVPLSSGVAKYPLGAFAPGAHAITATYSGSESYEAGAAALVQEVTMADTELTLTSSKNPAAKGSAGTIKATVKSISPGGGTPTGAVTFREGEAVLATIPLSNKIATYPLKSLPVGSHEITAVYGGSVDYQPSESSISQVITP